MPVELRLTQPADVETVQRDPDLLPVLDEDYRRALMRRFPYAVFYGYDGRVVTVHAVLHTARDPGKWRQRLP